MPPSQDISRLTSEVHHVTQGYRLMLWNFTLLVPIFNRLKEARELNKMVQESIPPLLAFFAEVVGPDWTRPRIPAATQDVFAELLRELNTAGISSIVSQWIMGRQPLAVEFHDFFTQANIVGIFRKAENNFQIIFRNVEGSLKITYFLAGIVGAKLRSSEKQERITYDKKPPRGLTLGPNKGKGKGQANKGKGRGNVGKGAKGRGNHRSRCPRQLRPVGAPNNPPNGQGAAPANPPQPPPPTPPRRPS